MPAQMVAVIKVRGILCTEVAPFDCGFPDAYSGEGSIADQARAADADPEVVAVVLDVLSPGGDILGLGEAADQLAALRSASSKPWLVYARKACSAAYWISVAAAGDGGLFVSQSSDVGNIGTWCCHADFSAANEEDGVKYTYVADPPGKTIGNPDEPLDPEALARMQRQVSEHTARFAEAVASYRPTLTVESIRSLNGDTRRGAAAVDAGLADGVAGSLEDVIALAFSRAAALADAPATITTSSTGVAPAPKGSADVKPTAALLALVPGLDASASDAAIESAVLPLLGLSRAALALTGTGDPQAAEGALRAYQRDAAKLPALVAQLAEVHKAKGDEALKAEASERKDLVGKMVKGGRLTAAEAWTRDSESGEITGVAAEWSLPNDKGEGISIVALRAMAEKLQPLGVGTESKADEKGAAQATLSAAAGAVLSDADRAECARGGKDPVKFAAIKASMFSSVQG